MKTTIFSFLLLAGLIFTGCSNKHPKIGFLIHSFESPRWKNDQKYFVDAVKQMGGVPIVKVADNNAEMQLEQAKGLINQGVKVLVVIPVNQKTAAKIVNAAHEKGIQVIAYDRLINNCRLDYYVSTDNVRVGEIQASYLSKIKPKGNYALIGGPPNDNNSRMLYIGQLNILQPLVELKEINIAFRQFANYWTTDEGYRLAIAGLDSLDNKLDAIICGNDAMALGAIKALKERGLEGKVAVAGQDADVPNIQQIMKGNQSVTVFKRIKTMASTAAELAVHLAKKEPLEPYLSTISNGDRLVPSYLVDAVAVNEGNIEMTVVAERN
ncbi:MAG: sugar ABC transporter substrate-binding protein [Mariniphaga sp.]|nr:sugar ABC transporter substrate-binding protein [Mariniphaga sp.]